MEGSDFRGQCPAMARHRLAAHNAARSQERVAHARWICPLAQLCSAQAHCQKWYPSRPINRSGLLALGLPTDLAGSTVCKKCSNRVVSAKAKAKKSPHVDPEQPVLPPVVELVEEPSDDAAFLELKRKLSEAEARIVALSSAVPEKTKTKKPAKRKKPRTSQKGHSHQ